LRTTSRPANPDPDRVTPEIGVIVHGDTTIAALDKAIRILTGERDALMEAMPVTSGSFPIGGEDEDEEEDS
ncbi:MAG: hypothetical protein ABW022_11280, partial [Actinoplanes sp.]